MQALMGIAGLLLVGAITPGPNNLVVMREAAHAGWRGALLAILGIVAGGLALLAMVAAGAGPVLAAVPGLAVALTVGGCAYLAFLGIRHIAASGRAAAQGEAEAQGLPTGVLGLFVFQFLNPKGWVTVLTVTAAAQAALGAAALPSLVVFYTVIPAICLTLWSCLGMLTTRLLQRPTFKPRLDRTMGALLVVAALLLLREATSLTP